MLWHSLSHHKTHNALHFFTEKNDTSFRSSDTSKRSRVFSVKPRTHDYGFYRLLNMRSRRLRTIAKTEKHTKICKLFGNRQSKQTRRLARPALPRDHDASSLFAKSARTYDYDVISNKRNTLSRRLQMILFSAIDLTGTINTRHNQNSRARPVNLSSRKQT